jgi:hypothetical protein
MDGQHSGKFQALNPDPYPLKNLPAVSEMDMKMSALNLSRRLFSFL